MFCVDALGPVLQRLFNVDVSWRQGALSGQPIQLYMYVRAQNNCPSLRSLALETHFAGAPPACVEGTAPPPPACAWSAALSLSSSLATATVLRAAAAIDPT
jgi:hypothetical protein